jgi:hypothetical protein
MDFERRKAQVYHAIFSLLPVLREQVLQEMRKHRTMKKYIPIYQSSDVRTCCPDTLYSYFEKHEREMSQSEYRDRMRLFEKIPAPPSPPPPNKQSNNTRKLLSLLYDKYT